MKIIISSRWLLEQNHEMWEAEASYSPSRVSVDLPAGRDNETSLDQISRDPFD